MMMLLLLCSTVDGLSVLIKMLQRYAICDTQYILSRVLFYEFQRIPYQFKNTNETKLNMYSTVVQCTEKKL